jgi:uncharacterized protein (TIGR03067 family)
MPESTQGQFTGRIAGCGRSGAGRPPTAPRGRGPPRVFVPRRQCDTIHFLGDETTPGADLWFSYTLDPSKNPKTIDMKLTKSPDKKDLGKVQLGIYVLEGDQLKICASEKKRPAKFAADEASHTAVVVFKREKK